MSSAYIFSSQDDSTTPFFQGFCFLGSDYVAGARGLSDYENATGQSITEPQDGCYVHVRRDGDTYSFSSDFWGYHAVFYFFSPGFWLVSNSLTLIAERLLASGIPPKPDMAVLLASTCKSNALQQLACFQTAIQGVKLVPARCRLDINKSAAQLVYPAKKTVTAENYSVHLSRFLSVWLARIKTLLRDDRLQISFDVTGGIDSRCVLALFLRARMREQKLAAKINFRCGAIRGDRRDMEVAQAICDAFGLPLNEKVSRHGRRLSADESYEHYRRLDLGCYYPVYPPALEWHPQDITFGGSGGENFRTFYGKGRRLGLLSWLTGHDPLRIYMKELLKKIPDKNLAREFESKVMDAIQDVQRIDSGGGETLMLHYQHFRNRFHAGRTAKERVHVMALSSGLLHNACLSAGKSRLKSRQIHYDILSNLVPGLLDLPFDHGSKNPSLRHRRNVTGVTITEIEEPGNVYFHAPDEVKGLVRPESFFTLLRHDLERLSMNPLARQLFDPTTTAQTVDVIRQAEAMGRLSHACDGIAAAALLSTSMFEQA